MKPITQFSPLDSANSIDKATIKAINNQLFLVTGSQGIQNAKVAASCLIAPDVGDTVMICTLAGECYITAVLEKQQSAHRIKVDGDLKLETSGVTTLSSKGGINQVSSGEVAVTANSIRQTSNEQQVTCKSLNMHTQDSSLQAKNINVVAEQSNTVINRCYQKAEQVMRWVETIETLNIGTWVQNIKGTLNSRAQNQIMTAKSDVKVDAERIHMG